MNDITLKIPNHVAIIVDGNGRWAKEKGKTRSEGHYAGFNNIKPLSDYIFSKGVKVLSLYLFSTENFKREKKEVDYLMNLIAKDIKGFTKDFNKNNIKVVVSGRMSAPLPDKCIKSLNYMMEETKNNTSGIINLCINYGGHAEIIDASKKIASDINSSVISADDIDEEVFNKYLYNDLPPVDLLIRTSGEQRVSGFLLWQLSYAEFYFPKTYFPDFDSKCFDEALIEYTKRDRRFGGINYNEKSN